LILRKIIKIVATRCRVLKLKCTKFDFGWGSYSAPPHPLAGYNGAYGKAWGRTGGKGNGGGEGRGGDLLLRRVGGKGGRKGEEGKGVKGSRPVKGEGRVSPPNLPPPLKIKFAHACDLVSGELLSTVVQKVYLVNKFD